MQPRTVYRPPANNQRYQPQPKKKHRLAKVLSAVVIVALIAVGAAYGWSKLKSSNNNSGQAQASKQVAKTNYCANNTLANFVLVSITKQHLWACGGSKQLYDSPVVTGMEQYPADLTPPGTYHIYGKETNQTLTGSDATGSWSDPVSYWMPFLDNQYGAYGFHDATWRSPDQFGKVNINAPYTAAVHGSHGCVELPLATAKWLYNWAPVGTTVTVES